MGYILESESRGLLRAIEERQRRAKGDSKVLSLWRRQRKKQELGPRFGVGTGPQRGRCGRDHTRGRVQMNWGSESEGPRGRRRSD